ncbi:MAG: DUF3329 domain-containing protein [Treponemataceae bacterium]
MISICAFIFSVHIKYYCSFLKNLIALRKIILGHDTTRHDTTRHDTTRQYYNKFLKFYQEKQSLFFYGLVFAVFCIMYALNYFTILIADDYNYSLGKTGKVQSLLEIIELEYNQYMGWGGRSVAHFLGRFFLWVGKPVFNIFNALVYVIFVLLICRHIDKNCKKNSALFIAINISLWYFIPAWGQNFLWLIGSCNYLWTSMFVLLFLLPYKKNIENSSYNLNLFYSILVLLFGVIAGWTNENLSAAVVGGLFCFFVWKIIKKQKIKLFEILGFIGFFVGFLFLVLAPGNYVRAASSAIQSDLTLLEKLGSRFFSVSAIYLKYSYIILSLFFCLLAMNGKKYIQHSPFFMALFFVYFMILSPKFSAVYSSKIQIFL